MNGIQEVSGSIPLISTRRNKKGLISLEIKPFLLPKITEKRIYPRRICSSQKIKHVISVTIASPPCMRMIFGLLVMLP